MPVEEPAWWYGPPDSAVARALRPLAWLYGRLAARRIAATTPYRSRLPVVCIGNFTAGGTGKTPLTLDLARRLIARGEHPAILTRGYGGRLEGPHWIDPNRDSAQDVGDEPLLLARLAPTLLAKDRRAGAIAIETAPAGYTVILMDDGLQNPALAKDLAIAVVDARRGLGNGAVIPAGPLRAPLDLQLRLTDMILVNHPPQPATPVPDPGQSDALANAADAPAAIFATLRRAFPGPVLAARVAPAGDTGWIARQPLLAFAGIANPDRFFALLEQHGGRIAARAVFKDHHTFTIRDADQLLARARADGLVLATTEKDHARLAGSTDATLADLAAATRTLPIGLQFSEEDGRRLDELIAATLATAGEGDGPRSR